MNDLQRVPISSSPGYPDVVRKIAVIGKNEDYQGRTVTLICAIEHYDQDDNRLKAFAAIEGCIFASGFGYKFCKPTDRRVGLSGCRRQLSRRIHGAIYLA
jgi:hypothetical protein